MAFTNLKEKLNNKIKNNTFFKKHFGFESGIDITDENQVLYRKNVVVKNIIFVTNLIYTVMFTLVSIGQKYWMLTLLFFPVTFIVNSTLKKLIKKGPDDVMSQIIAMYFASFYIFLSSVLIYLRLKVGRWSVVSGEAGTVAIKVDLAECGYILLYYSLLISAFYQNNKMFKNICKWMFSLVTILHFVLTYPILMDAMNEDFFTYLPKFLTSSEFKDILVRSILLLLFMLVLYIYVTMANYMQEERKKELIKRREVQEDFTNVVSKIFDVTLSNNIINTEVADVEIISIMSKKLASLLSLEPDKCDEIAKFARIHIDESIDFNSSSYHNEDEKFESLRLQTELGSKLISRYQLMNKCEAIVRAALEENDDDEFIKKQREIQNDMDAQIILLCEMYVTLRSIKSYKRALNHQKSITFLTEHCKLYFDAVVFDRFIRFDSDFENMYDQM